MKDFLETMIGPVKEIFSIKQFKEDLFHYKEISEIIHQYKIESCKEKSQRVNDKDRNERMLELFNEFYHYYLKVISLKNE